MNVNRGLIFWGVTLITAGAVALAIEAGAIAGEQTQQLWRFWPVALIVIGLAVIAARTPLALVATVFAALVVGGLGGALVSGVPHGLNIGCSGEPDGVLTESGSFDGAASVTVDFDCGDLTVSTAPGSAWDVEARHSGGHAPEIASDGGSLSVGSEGGGIFGVADARQEWDVTLPADTTLDLSVSANAASSTLNLGGATLSGLSVDADAGSISIETDASTTLAGSVEMNAGSLELCIPDGVVFAITLADDNITFSHNLDDSGLIREGDTWVTGDDAVPSITVHVDGNAASFTLNPEDGCS